MNLSEVEKHLAAQAANEAFKDELAQIAKNAALASYEDRDLNAMIARAVEGRRRFCALLGLQS